MRLVDIALKGLKRRIGRMLLLVVGLAVGVATVVALVAITGSMRLAVSNKFDEFGANIVIVPRSGDLSLSYGGITVGSTSYDVGELTLQDLEAITTIKNARNVSVVAPKLLTAVTLRDRQVLLAGVHFADEIRLKQWWALDGVYPLYPEEAIIGARLAEAFDVRPDEILTLEGRAVKVTGVLKENGSQDDQILFVALPLAQEIASRPDSINLVEVAALCTECPIEEMVAQISEVLPQARVTALRQAVTLRMETVGQLSRFAAAVSAVVTVIGALVVLMTMLGAVAERRREIGLFRALGLRQRHIEQVILTEALLVSLAGGLGGWLVGMVTAVALKPAVADLSGPVAWDPLLLVGALSGSVVVGLGASLYPAIRAARLDPSSALRAI